MPAVCLAWNVHDNSKSKEGKNKNRERTGISACSFPLDWDVIKRCFIHILKIGGNEYEEKIIGSWDYGSSNRNYRGNKEKKEIRVGGKGNEII